MIGRSPVWLRFLGVVVATAGFLATACGADTARVDLDSAGGDQPVIVAASPRPGAVSAPPVELPGDLSLRLAPVLDVDQPVALARHPRTGVDYLATKTGIVATVDLAAGTIGTPVLDIGDGLATDFQEQGLLGLAFSPDGGHLYLNFTDGDGSTVIAEYPANDGVVDGDAGREVLRVAQPAVNHNGGSMAFGPDGNLFIAFGDGGGSNDQYGNGQDTETLLGSIARIRPRVDGAPYGIPADNPFAERGGRAEILLYGLRNPWRFSFDRLTGDLWIADVGQDALEEIDVLYASDGWVPGANLGWPRVEGTAPFAASEPPAQDYVAPVYEYGHDEGCSVTGGYVYRGSAIPELTGSYIFGDYCAGELWGLASSQAEGLIGRFDLGLSLAERKLVGFYEDGDGELYVLGFDDTIYRIEPA